MQEKHTEQPRSVTPEQHAGSTVDFFDAQQSPETAALPVQEQHEAVELQQEQVPKDEGSAVDKTIDALKRSLRLSKKKKAPAIPQVRDEITLEVEQILEEGLGDAFRALTPVQQQEFKIKGEEVAYGIRSMFSRPKLKIRSLFSLILEWLKMLPGINRFFLQQEAKIKVDKIVALHKHKHHQ